MAGQASQPLTRRGPGRSPVVFAATVDLDIGTELALRTQLLDVLREPAVRSVLVDVSSVFVDVRGLAALLDSAEVAARCGVSLTVVASRSVRRIAGVFDLGPHLGVIDNYRTEVRRAV